MTSTSGLGGAKFLTVSNVNYRAPSNGQGSATGTFPTSYMAGCGTIPLYGFWLRDTTAAGTFTFGDSRGQPLTELTGSTVFSFATAIGSLTPRWIPFGRKGVRIPFWHFYFTGATWAPGARTLTKVGAFTNYTWASGDVLAVVSGTGVTRGNYQIASRDSADQITLVETIGDVSTNVAAKIGYGGGVTAKTSSASASGSLLFGHSNMADSGSLFMFINTTSARHPLDGQGDGTTTLSPVPDIGAGRNGARIHGILITGADAAASTITIGQAGGAGTITINVSAAAGITLPHYVDFGDNGLDYYSSTEGLFTCWSSAAATVGMIFFNSYD